MSGKGQKSQDKKQHNGPRSSCQCDRLYTAFLRPNRGQIFLQVSATMLLSLRATIILTLTCEYLDYLEGTLCRQNERPTTTTSTTTVCVLVDSTTSQCSSCFRLCLIMTSIHSIPARVRPFSFDVLQCCSDPLLTEMKNMLSRKTCCHFHGGKAYVLIRTKTNYHSLSCSTVGFHRL